MFGQYKDDAQYFNMCEIDLRLNMSVTFRDAELFPNFQSDALISKIEQYQRSNHVQRRVGCDMILGYFIH